MKVVWWRIKRGKKHRNNNADSRSLEVYGRLKKTKWGFKVKEE